MSNTTTMSRVIGKDEVCGDVGLELEVELESPAKFSLPFPWTCKKEGSLRNHGIEFITRSAISIHRVDTAIEKLIDLVHKNKGVDMCSRASFHVHHNITKYTPIQVWNIAVAYWFFENLLFKYCGEDQRAGNLFCLRVIDAPNIINTVYKDMRYIVPFSEFANNTEYRYAGLNLNAIHKFGSVEFRGMSCKLNTKHLSTWVKELHSMVTAATKFSSPEDIYREYQENKGDLKVFMKKFFSNTFVDTLTSFKGWESDITSQEGLLIGVCFLNWDKWLKAQAKELDNVLKEKEKTFKRNLERQQRDANAYAEALRRDGRPQDYIQSMLERSYPSLYKKKESKLVVDYASWMIGSKIENEKGEVEHVIGEDKQPTNQTVRDVQPPQTWRFFDEVVNIDDTIDD